MEHIGSLRRGLWNYIRPQVQELAGYFTATLAVSLVAAYQLLFGAGAQDSEGSVTALKDAIITNINTVTNNDSWGHILLFGFWFLVGTGVYFLVWFLINIFVDMYNDVVVSTSFMHPRSFHQSHFWGAILVRTILRILIGISLAVYTVLWFAVLAPIWVGTAKHFFAGPDLSGGLLYAATVVGICVTIHVAIVLLRVATLRPVRDDTL